MHLLKYNVLQTTSQEALMVIIIMPLPLCQTFDVLKKKKKVALLCVSEKTNKHWSWLNCFLNK